MVKMTLIKLIDDFFIAKGGEAVLYLCLNNDGKGKSRQAMFGKWFKDFKGNYERHQSSAKHEPKGFYGAVLLRTDNPIKAKIVQAFHYTIDYYWGLSQG